MVFANIIAQRGVMTAIPLPSTVMAAGNPSLEGAAAVPPPPGTDMTGICFRDQLWLNTYPLDRNLVFDYFALSPFYDWTCNNEQLRSRSIHPLDSSYLSCALNFDCLKSLFWFVYLFPFLLILSTIRKMTGNEYILSEVMEPHLFVIRKVKRDSPEKTMAMLTYYILDGSIYQAPQLCNVFAARIGRSIYHMSKAFNIAASKLEKIGYVDSGSKSTNSDISVAKEAVNIKEMKRVDHILSSIQRKLPPAPVPPPFPQGYAPPTSVVEKGPEDLQNLEAQLPPLDPIIDQGPAKRMKLQ